MITAGIDMGAQTVKVVILSDGQIIGSSVSMVGFDLLESAQKTLDEAINTAGISRDDIKRITATGSGRKSITIADNISTEISCDAKGATWLLPSVRTVIDIGAEEARAVSCDETGKVLDFVKNDKCAAGVGAFVDSMSRALELTAPEMIDLSFKSTKDVQVNVTCVVFAESEVVSLIHAKTEKADIAHAIHDAIATRTTSMTRRIPLNNEVALVGGVANNAAVLAAMNKHLGVEVVIPENPQFVGALGAAVLAAT
ncbi:acyl-CoA dehydratase activase [Chloroflexota bacterium]